VAAQDDVREREMRTLFNLTRPEEYGRADIDAVLELKGRAVPAKLHGTTVPFELKSATSGTAHVSTVRDFGLHHLEKWRPLHWIFGVYKDGVLQYCLYGSPQAMKPWFDEKAAYVAPDVALVECVPELITDATLTTVLGAAAEFDGEDVRHLMKKTKGFDYATASDLPGGRCSRGRMLELLRFRCRYVIERGATLNNPHISASYFEGWERITEDHAARLRELVVAALG
jgi:hypothetical protein